MNWNAQVFAYCERGQSGAFWAEPLNAITNGAFLLTGLAALMAWSALPTQRRGLAELALIVLVIVIGIGSFLFHTLATRWAAVADTAPIGIFMLAYLGYALRRFAGLGWIWTLLGVALFVVALQWAGSIRCGGGACLNGSVGYLPAFAVLAAMGLWLIARRHKAGAYLLGAAGTFAISLTFRTIDRAVCPMTILAGSGPLGTHFLWHILNATLLYLLLMAAVRHGRPRAEGAYPPDIAVRT